LASKLCRADRNEDTKPPYSETLIVMMLLELFGGQSLSLFLISRDSFSGMAANVMNASSSL